MDHNGRPQANGAAATAFHRRGAPTLRFAIGILATTLMVAVSHHAVAKDPDESETTRRIKTHFAASKEPDPVSQPSASVPGIRQPDFATPIGGVPFERDTDNASNRGPASMAKASRAADEHKATPDGEKPTLASGAPVSEVKPDSSWSSLWRTVFASDAPPPPSTPPASKPPASSSAMASEQRTSPTSYAERVVTHTSNAADELLQIVSPTNDADSSYEEVVPPSSGMADESVEPRAPRLFKLTESVVDSGSRAGVFGLGQQLAMRSDDVPPPESAGRSAVSSPQAAGSRRSLDDSSLLQPFKATNPAVHPSEGGSGLVSGDVSSQASQRADASSSLGMLGGQLTMSTDANYRSRAESVDQSTRLPESNRNASWTLPTMTNPLMLTQQPGSAATTATEGTRLAGYQEALPAPPDPENDDENPFTSGESEQSGSGESKTLAGAERVGEEPEDNTLQFLRTQTVLLEPGESQCDIGINYLFTENRFPILLLDNGNPVGADDVLFRIRELTIPLEYRVGLLNRVQGFIGAPIGWSNTQVALGDYEQFDSDGGFGDLDFGTTIQVIEGNAECPHGLVTISATAPTGGDPFGPAAVLAQSAPSLGQGFWSVSANALCIQTYDPLVFFYGVGAEHFFSRHFNEREIEPGNSWNYSFGVGFAVNDRVTLSTRFLGSYIEEVRINRQRVLGTNVEPMSIRMAATISKPCNRIVEPFVEFGITESAVESFFGITWTY
jgi:hypothetical protein